jgi:hypothetical protein
MRNLYLCIFCLSFSFLYAQETVEGVRRQIKAVEAETAREKNLHETEKKRHAEFVETSRKKVIALNSQRAALNAELDSMHAEIVRLSAARNKAVGITHWYENRKLKYQESLAMTIDSLAPFLESDFPYRASEAAESIRETASQLRKGIISPDDALGRTLEVLGERIRMGYTTEVWEGFLSAPDGRSVAGKYFRYGAVAGIFLSADGNDIFWLSKTEKGYSWNDVGASLTLRTRIREAMKVAEGKGAPHIVEIPISGVPGTLIPKNKKETAK